MISRDTADAPSTRGATGKGSASRADLPSGEASEGASPPEVDLRPRRGRVLVVDDEPLIARSVKRILAAEHDVEVLTEARDALARIAAGEAFDVILCDLMMPEMSGMELYAELLRVASPQTERMIFLTGGAFTPEAREFLAGVPNPRLEKPFDVKDLRALLRERIP